ncbi:transporter substrate-binding domain-containing protein [Shewanella eurypsychrophilus]|uniref:Transporter substrate-binding domain-containing protein n=1 Tax=Shewanella eurypsychrophilus TaxID=2593656 RepID=A0ABX6V597_9GAMM|nr:MULTISPECIES: transporter substrate-binding domain-containing protein [Shewanella]QFU22520.1 transporter substrate-binding domain-containing protein [Shewanella sp. YLB-09]QPG57808.1 transporter substrate-binding domain-containing protein [Shewanella eurypsychrophilus]
MLRAFFILFIVLFTLPSSAQPLTYLSISSQAEPFQIIHKTNKGIVTDILSQAVQDLDITLTEQAYPFMRYIRTMHAGKYPLWVSYGSPAWQDETEMAIQSRILSKEKLFDVSHVLVVKANRHFNLYSIEALFGETVIILNGFHYPGLDEYIETGQIKTVTVKSHESALKAVENSRGIAFIAMKTRALYTISQTDLERKNFKLIDFSSIIPPYPIHLSYSDTVNEEVKHKIDQAISRLKDSGEVDNIISFYQDSGEKSE